MNHQALNHRLKAVLFDLDGTLLDVDINIFMDHYVNALAAHVAHMVPPQRFVPCLMQGSQAMLANDGRDTNQAVFDQVFFPCAGLSREELEPVFMDFYTNAYPKLRQYTRRKPEARLAVRAAFDRGWDVVIATNPLFPLVAVQQRMEWAGVAGFPYRLITHYKNSRAAKPNLLYFKQVLDVIGHPAEACLMVGDEDLDMVAAELGLTTFLVPSARTELEPTTPEPTYRGTLDDVVVLLQDAK
jgi:FMN phosphatase YigB (HAD superfamily)